MFALHRAFEQSTKSVEEAARAERERRGQLAKDPSSPAPRTLSADHTGSSQNASITSNGDPQTDGRPRRFPLPPSPHSYSYPSSPRNGTLPRQPGPPPATRLPPTPKHHSPSLPPSVPGSPSILTPASFKRLAVSDGPRTTRSRPSSPNNRHARRQQRAVHQELDASTEPDSPVDGAFSPQPALEPAEELRAELGEQTVRETDANAGLSLRNPRERGLRSPLSSSRLRDLGRGVWRDKGSRQSMEDRDESSPDPNSAFDRSAKGSANNAPGRKSMDSRMTSRLAPHPSSQDDPSADLRGINGASGMVNGRLLSPTLSNNATLHQNMVLRGRSSTDSGRSSSRASSRQGANGIDTALEGDNARTPIASPRLGVANVVATDVINTATLSPSQAPRFLPLPDHRNAQPDQTPALPGENFNVDPFATRKAFPARPSLGDSQAISPGSVPPSSDYWSAEGSRPSQNHRLGQAFGRIRSSDNLKASSLSSSLGPSTGRLSQDGGSRRLPQSKSGSRLVRVFSKRRPRTSMSDQETNRSLSPESAFHRVSSPTAHGSMENARSSSSHERGLGRVDSATGSVESHQSPPPGSRLESSGGAAALFGGGSSGARPRTASLLPSLSIFGGSTSRNKLSPNPPATATFGSAASSTSALNRSIPATTPDESGRSSVGLSSRPVASHNGQQQGSSLVASRDSRGLKPLEGESAEEFAARVDRIADRSEVANILASSGDRIYAEALHAHMQRFLFVGNPLDIALRKMLMELCLPKETQQIDRVMEAFAKRYNECNEGLYASEDQPYILAFSLMMLHTDAFNRNAKVKMTKADYVKNSSSSGVPQDILEYLYDNLTFTQFVYSNEADQQRKPSGSASGHGTASGFLAQMSSASKDKSNKIDAYLLIKQGRLSQFQPAIEHAIPEDDPYSYTGTSYNLNIAHLARAYVSAPSIEIAAAQSPPPSDTSYNGQWPGPELSGARLGAGGLKESSVTLRVFKVGIVSRKDDVTDKSKKQSRRWRASGMILSSSQLLFFRDLVWIEALHAQIGEQLAAADPEERKRGVLISPRISNFRPDGVLSLGDAIAVRDESYDKHHWVIRLIGVQGSASNEYLFHTRDETDMNEWIAGINFCACFRAFGVRATNIDAVALASATRDVSSAANSGTLTLNGSNSMGHPQMLKARIEARRRELSPLLEEVDQKLNAHARELAELLRLARHFAILTPFQRATRERIEAAAVPLAARIRELRILVAKNECRRFILASEIQNGEESVGAYLRSIGPEASQGSSELIQPQTPITPNLLAERKSSFFSNADSSDGHLSSPGVEALGVRSASGTVQGSGRTGGLGSVSEVSELEPPPSALGDDMIPAGPSIGSFASQAQGPVSSSVDSPSGVPMSSSRSFKMKFSGKGKGRGEGESESSDIAESWQSTRAFRDPDRISLAQLPSIEQIEAATREKARRRGAHHATSSANASTSRKGSYAYSGSSVSGSYRGDASSSRNISGSNKGSSSKSAGKSTGSGSSGKTNRLHSQPADPPVFMHTWGS